MYYITAVTNEGRERMITKTMDRDHAFELAAFIGIPSGHDVRIYERNPWNHVTNDAQVIFSTEDFIIPQKDTRLRVPANLPALARQ